MVSGKNNNTSIPRNQPFNHCWAASRAEDWWCSGKTGEFVVEAVSLGYLRSFAAIEVLKYFAAKERKERMEKKTKNDCGFW